MSYGVINEMLMQSHKKFKPNSVGATSGLTNYLSLHMHSAMREASKKKPLIIVNMIIA
jgi:hypothetical protein